jgi:phage repressor protein C with HTH and peptisase S24 domain
MMETLWSRLKLIAEEQGHIPPIRGTVIQELIGVTSGRVSQIKLDPTTSLSEESMARLTARGYNPDWVRDGSPHQKRITTSVVDVYVNQDGDIATVDRYIIPVLDVSASMGIGAPQPDQETIVDNIRLTKRWADQNLGAISSPKNLAVLSAYGDSMSPTFSDGDLLLVDRGVTSIKLDAVYVLALNKELYIKRIQRRITDGAVIIKSDNPLYDPVTVENGERQGLQVLGRVVWAWNGKKL